MILSDKVILKINPSNFKYYLNVINDIKSGNEYQIKIDDLHKGSHIKILVECDICYNQSMKPYRQYLESFNKGGFYCCSSKCSQIKNKNTKKEIYNDENYNNINKQKETCIKKYNVNSYLKTKEKQEKSKITYLNKYGVESSNSSNIVKIHKKESMLINYNVENPSQLDKIKDKKNLTVLKNYGVSNPSQSVIVKLRMKESRILNGNQIPDEKLTEFRKYSKLVINETNMIKKELFLNWNGYDYYDNEYIKENFILNSNNSNYPTIDHKISLYYGFINNINSKEISKLENLCITKRYINSIKNKKCFYERKK